jgi:hypothetical protein
MTSPALARLRSLLRELPRSESGIALPMAMIITVIGLGLASVPVIASISSQSGGTNNQRGNEALAAAEAGAERAVLAQSQLLAGDPDALCENGSLQGAGWCPKVGPEEIGLAAYEYELRPCYEGGAGGAECTDANEQAECEAGEGGGAVQVVSTGISNGVQKRVEVTACASSEGGLLPEEVEMIEEEQERGVIETSMEKEKAEGKDVVKTQDPPTYLPGTPVTVPPPNVYVKGQIVGIDWLNMNNNAQVYNGGAGSNGSVKMSGSANVCGTVSYGTTFSTDNSSSNQAPSGCAAGRTVGKGTAEYPAVDLPANIATSNSNSRLVSQDPVGPNVWQRGNISWNSSNRSLTVSYDQLTLEGTLPYFLCKLTLAGGSKLLAGSGKSIRIFFDAPQNCPGLNGGSQLQIANGAYVGADSNHGPGFYFVGSSTANASRIELGGGANVSQFVVYAPYSAIVANNGVNVNGVIIGRTLELGGGAYINKSAFTPPAVGDFIEPETVAGPETEVPGAFHEYPSESWVKNSEKLKTVTDRITELVKIITEKGGGGSAEAATIEKSLFVECSAVPDGASPDSGC